MENAILELLMGYLEDQSWATPCPRWYTIHHDHTQAIQGRKYRSIVMVQSHVDGDQRPRCRRRDNISIRELHPIRYLRIIVNGCTLLSIDSEDGLNNRSRGLDRTCKSTAREACAYRYFGEALCEGVGYVNVGGGTGPA